MIEINSLIIILIFGSLLSFTFLLIANPIQVNKKANFWFAIFLFSWSTFWLEEIFTLIVFQPASDSFMIPIRILQFLTPIIFYYSIQFYSKPDFRLKKKEFLYLVLPIIYFLGLIALLKDKENSILSTILTAFVIIQAFYFLIYSYIKIQHHKKRIRLFSSNTNEIDLSWLENIIKSLFGLIIFIGVYNMLFRDADLNLFANVVMVIIVFFVGFNSIKQKEIFLLNENQRNLIITTEEQTITDKRKIITDKEVESLKVKLTELMEKQKPYLDSELTLVSLAELIELTPHQLSYLINGGFNENFFWFINRYRVKRVKELLSNKHNDHMSILGIAFESGFNSKTSFNTTFKKISSQTPSEFKKSCSSL